ncbi:hypothetical protein [Sporofaciens sp. SGI.106]|uniref:hypothetical protein n=1 Tax=Sporofaciens sp. SGI.106 TaxID=3420568 RepID=UPI003D036B52
MLTLIFTILMLLIFGKIIGFAVKAAWGISKIICTVVLLPLFLIGLVFAGLIGIAFPILLIVGIVSLLIPKSW